MTRSRLTAALRRLSASDRRWVAALPDREALFVALLLVEFDGRFLPDVDDGDDVPLNEKGPVARPPSKSPLRPKP